MASPATVDSTLNTLQYALKSAYSALGGDAAINDILHETSTFCGPMPMPAQCA